MPVVSHDLWRSRLGAREDIYGAAVTLNGTAFTVVGVAPEGFQGVVVGRPSSWWPARRAARIDPMSALRDSG